MSYIYINKKIIYSEFKKIIKIKIYNTIKIIILIIKNLNKL